MKRIQTRISPDILDTIGRTFKFRHGKGVAEWLKNSLDSYRRLHDEGEEQLPGQWPVVLHLINGSRTLPGPNLAVVDFGGTSYSSVDEFFLHWGDTSAATHGGASRAQDLTGGHGNGGKFYMREMWRDGARFLTFREGKLTSLIVDKKESQTTGYWEYENESVKDWRTALKLAFPVKENLLGSDWLVQHLETEYGDITSQLDTGTRGLTVVVGRRAEQVLSSNGAVVGSKWDDNKLIDELRNATQARRPIRELQISVFVDGKLRLRRLEPGQINYDPEWPGMEAVVPGSCVDLASQSIGSLRISKALFPLTGRHRDWNALWVLDSRGNPVARYPLTELALTAAPTILSFLTAELSLAFEGFENLITNDRERLVESPNTTRILTWVETEIDNFAETIHKKQLADARMDHLRLASILNEHLNEHAQRFLEKLQSEMLVDFIEDPGGGGPGPSGSGTGKAEGPGGQEGQGGAGGSEGSGGTIGKEGSQARTKRQTFPVVLLSGYDEDPARGDGQSKTLTENHPPLHQDDIDRNYNVWWINTSHTFARQAISRGGGAGGAYFKSYQLFMFRDVVQRESLRVLQRRESEIAVDQAETVLDEYSNRFLGDLPIDILEELLK